MLQTRNRTIYEKACQEENTNPPLLPLISSFLFPLLLSPSGSPSLITSSIFPLLLPGNRQEEHHLETSKPQEELVGRHITQMFHERTRVHQNNLPLFPFLPLVLDGKYHEVWERCQGGSCSLINVTQMTENIFFCVSHLTWTLWEHFFIKHNYLYHINVIGQTGLDSPHCALPMSGSRTVGFKSLLLLSYRIFPRPTNRKHWGSHKRQIKKR